MPFVWLDVLPCCFKQDKDEIEELRKKLEAAETTIGNLTSEINEMETVNGQCLLRPDVIPYIAAGQSHQPA